MSSLLLDTLAAIYRTATKPEEWPEALTAIAKCFDDVGALLIYERSDGSFATIVSPSLAEAQAAYQNYWWQEDICFSRMVERRCALGDAITDRHLVTPEEIVSHPFYRLFRLKYGLGPFGAVSISPLKRNSVVVSVQRAYGKAQFSEEELLLLRKIGQHVENALHLGIRLLDTEAINHSLAEILSQLDIGLFVLNNECRIIFANSNGKSMIDDLSLSRDRMSLPTREAQNALLSLIEQWRNDRMELRATITKPILLPGKIEETRFAIYVMPARSITDIAPVITGEHFMLLAISSNSAEPIEPTLMRDLFGLTLSEARLASLVASGQTPEKAAQRLGITIGTARTALKRVFAKTGASRQSELAAMIARLAIG